MSVGAIVLLVCSIGSNFYLLFSLRERYHNEKIRAVFPVPLDENSYNPPDSEIKKRILLLGDSRIAQWSNLPEIDGIEFIRRGVKGETSAQLRLRITQELEVVGPDYVILQIGINDLVAAGIAPALEQKIARQLKDNYMYLLDECQKGNIGIYLLTIIHPDTPPLYRLPFWSSRIPLLVDEINQWLLDYIRKKYNITVLDSNYIFTSAPGDIKKIYKDTLHLNDKGYKILNKAIENIL
ncbi:MAG: hypothetical protein D3918_06275 [Candidatus Electrothrix sp. AX2]|nr:hypothetical protein [Candidatus Electrothrix gigas]